VGRDNTPVAFFCFGDGGQFSGKEAPSTSSARWLLKHAEQVLGAPCARQIEERATKMHLVVGRALRARRFPRFCGAREKALLL